MSNNETTCSPFKDDAMEEKRLKELRLSKAINNCSA
jgi:hypothetical protein